MRFAKAVAGIIFSFSFYAVFAQSDTVKIKISVVDSFTHKPIAGVNLIDPAYGPNVVTDSKGYVVRTIHKNDRLFLFYPSYTALKFSVADSAPKSEYVLHFILNPFSTGLSHELIIKAPKSLEQIEAERQKLGITPKELEKPEMNFTSPISALYDMLSHRAKEREKLKQQIAADEKDKILKELLNYCNEKQLIDLPEDHYDDFIRFCSLPTDFLKNHTNYEILKTITTYYNKYARLSGLVK